MKVKGKDSERILGRRRGNKIEEERKREETNRGK